MAAQTLPNTKQDLIASLVLRELADATNLFPLVTDYSSLVGKGMKSISLPKLDSFTVQDRVFGAVGADQTLTDSKDIINLNKNKMVKFIVDKADEFQSTIDFMLEGVRRASSAHGRQIDADIIAEWELIAGLNINAGVPADITAANILAMREFLMSKNADMNSVAMVIAPDQERAMLTLPEFSRFDYRGNGASPIVNGQIGTVYGTPVVINNQIKAQQAIMAEKGAVGFAFQRAPKVAQEGAIDYGTDAVKVVVDALYGLGGLSLGVNGVLATESPLVAKLIN